MTNPPQDDLQRVEAMLTEALATVESFGCRSKDEGAHGHKRARMKGQIRALATLARSVIAERDKAVADLRGAREATLTEVARWIDPCNESVSVVWLLDQLESAALSERQEGRDGD